MKEDKEPRHMTFSLNEHTRWIPAMIDEVAEAEEMQKSELIRVCLMEGLAARSKAAMGFFASWKKLSRRSK